MKEWAHAGRKVVCVQECEGFHPAILNLPRLNEIYTIRDAGEATCLSTLKQVISIRLYELVNPEHDFGTSGGVGEAGFKLDLFRPVDDRKTSIGVFTEMLGPALVDA